jgi:hypothetical protein
MIAPVPCVSDEELLEILLTEGPITSEERALFLKRAFVELRDKLSPPGHPQDEATRGIFRALANADTIESMHCLLGRRGPLAAQVELARYRLLMHPESHVPLPTAAIPQEGPDA